ncbi:MAG TPA: hypothetical protein VG603_05940, partial [Chitinophagales bacterium]|nr:hypothetical protein [Chitinophagales bacterium]
HHSHHLIKRTIFQTKSVGPLRAHFESLSVTPSFNRGTEKFKAFYPLCRLAPTSLPNFRESICFYLPLHLGEGVVRQLADDGWGKTMQGVPQPVLKLRTDILRLKDKRSHFLTGMAFTLSPFS